MVEMKVLWRKDNGSQVVGLQSPATQPNINVSIMLPVSSECVFCHCAHLAGKIVLQDKLYWRTNKRNVLATGSMLIIAFWRERMF